MVPIAQREEELGEKKLLLKRGEKKQCGVVRVMEEERKCWSSKEHREGENNVEPHQLDLESKGGREEEEENG